MRTAMVVTNLLVGLMVLLDLFYYSLPITSGYMRSVMPLPDFLLLAGVMFLELNVVGAYGGRAFRRAFRTIRSRL